jgi:hypothetical protein
VVSAIFQKKIDSRTHRVTQSLVGEVLDISIPGEKVAEQFQLAFL